MFVCWVSLEVATTCTSGSSSQSVETLSDSCGGSTGSEFLAVPKQLASKTKRQAVNAKASCITDTEVLEELKHQKKQEKRRRESGN